MKQIKTILKTKDPDIWSIGPDASVYDAIHLMAEKEIGALLVMEGSKLIGIFSERDYARQIILKDRSSESTKVREIMTSDVVHAELCQDSMACMELMTPPNKRWLQSR